MWDSHRMQTTAHGEKTGQEDETEGGWEIPADVSPDYSVVVPFIKESDGSSISKSSSLRQTL